jgi:hypothetical protein
VLAVQSRRGLGDDNDADRLIGAVGLVALFGTAEPEDVLRLAGTIRQVELSAQVEDGAYTGRGTASVQSSYRVDANLVRALEPGQAFLLAAGKAELVHVIPPRGLTAPPIAGTLHPSTPGRVDGRRGYRALPARVKGKLAPLGLRPLDPPGPGSVPGQRSPRVGEERPPADHDNQEVPE